MKGYTGSNIRNIALLGHSGCGKTTIAESILVKAGVIPKAGSVDAKNTVSDYDKIEREKGYSINSTLLPIEWKDTKFNFIDTPGYFDFAGEVGAALAAVEAAIIVVDAGSGIEVGTEQAWKACVKAGTPRFFLINKKEKDECDMETLIAELQDKFGESVAPFEWPVSEVSEALKEAIAMTDDDLMEKYFAGEEFTDKEIRDGLECGIKDGSIAPVCVEPYTLNGAVDLLLDLLAYYVPSPAEVGTYPGFDEDGNETACDITPDAPASGIVFKTVIDPFVGKISIIKVITGKFTHGLELKNRRSEKSEKLGKLLNLCGNQQSELEYAEAGDIVAVAKLQNTLSGDTLSEKGMHVLYKAPAYPKAKLEVAIEAAEKKQEDKVFSGLAKLAEEDPSFSIHRNTETRQTLLGGQGETQLNIIMEKLKDRYGVSVVTVPQKIAYRETIRGNSDVQGKHKKQSGGAGQYGDVHIRFSPCEEEFVFEESLFGGSIPKNYVPAIEKGLVESMVKGPLAGCKVTGVKAELYDGSYHDVDSNEMAFKIAASLAFKKGIVEAKPCLLEPIMHLEITVPDDNMGDIMGDMNKRRGRILGSEPLDNGDQKIMAEAPQAELFDYAITVRSMTQGRGSFEVEFERYDTMPQQMADKVIAAYKAEQEAK